MRAHRGSARSPATRGATLAVALASSLAVTLASSTRAGGGAPAVSQAVLEARAGRVVPTAPNDVERMCALLTSCDDVAIPPSLFPQDFAGCVTRMAGDLASPAAVTVSLAIRECARTAASCADLRSCALHGASEDACAGRGKRNVTGLCDADGRALTCWHDRVFAVRDCPRGGESCRVIDGEATCSLGACTADVQEPRCSASGTHQLRCDKGTLTSVNCAALGLSCVAGPACATAGPPCAGTSLRCEGGVAVGCLNGREVRVDCAAAGLACGGVGASVIGACSLPHAPGRSCDANAPARCEGGNLTDCAFGHPRSFACTSAGFSGCEAGKPAGPSEARCAP